MTLEAVVHTLSRHKEALKSQYGIRDIGVFGSVATGRAVKQSDIDIFYVMDEGRHLTLTQLDAFETEIKQLLKRRKVEFVNLRYMNPVVRFRAEQHFVYV